MHLQGTSRLIGNCSKRLFYFIQRIPVFHQFRIKQSIFLVGIGILNCVFVIEKTFLFSSSLDKKRTKESPVSDSGIFRLVMYSDYSSTPTQPLRRERCFGLLLRPLTFFDSAFVAFDSNPMYPIIQIELNGINIEPPMYYLHFTKGPSRT